MEKNRRFPKPAPSTIGAILLICGVAYEFIVSWFRHATNTARYGATFLIVVGVVVASRIILRKR